MATRRAAQQPASVAPSVTPQHGIELIRRQLVLLDEVYKLHHNDPAIRAWEQTTAAVLEAIFGQPNGNDHTMSRSFRNTYGSFQRGQSDAYYNRLERESLDRKRAVLNSCVEQLQILAPPIAHVATGQYVFHAEIERVSGHLFRDGHYKQAALEAYIRVIDEVKQRSGLNLDGDNLMNQAFSFDTTRMPVLQFNPMSNDAERDEQRGFMFMFKGMVLHRNFKAHSNQLFNDPLRAHDYLSFASLLMRMLELT